ICRMAKRNARKALAWRGFRSFYREVHERCIVGFVPTRRIFLIKRSTASVGPLLIPPVVK
ncbi:MAG: hypothetical protein QOJ56_1867, partial [Mycobacterium sp.]|nr:hypothetical protein [Mycobacterium sp.]